MTQLEILELALIGAKANLKEASDDYCSGRFGTIESIRSALFAYDDIKELIEKEKSPDCSHQPEQKINVVVDNELNTEQRNAVGSIALRAASLILSVAAILISILKG